MMIQRGSWVYGLLLASLLAILSWQAFEHLRVRQAARSALTYRARDITTTLGILIRSQRRFGGVVFQPSLESALNDLVKSEELLSVALLNASGDVVLASGEPLHFATKGMPSSTELWDRESVTVLNPVDLGAPLWPAAGTNTQPTIILPAPPPGTRDERSRFSGTPRSRDSTERRPDRRDRAENEGRADGEGRRGRSDRRWRFGRPPWMDEAEFKALTEKQGLHGLAIVISTDAYRSACSYDLWMRGLIGFFSIVSVLGIGLAWRNTEKSSEFEIRLLKASELNSHLREMNIAAAGLAHETRNPLNIIRGLAQIISKNNAAPPTIKENASRITSEVDLVTAQLNEFIHYSKPRELRRTSVDLRRVISEVVRALQSDLEDKQIQLNISDGPISIDADERLLRQVIFNLLINAIQAVDPGAEISIAIKRQNGSAVTLEFRDNGPGVAPEHYAEIFRPYFTTHQKGTGLGLAVVRQIVLAHGWDLAYEPNNGRGAVFRITGINVVPKTNMPRS